jgi:hypothetical protein
MIGVGVGKEDRGDRFQTGGKGLCNAMIGEIRRRGQSQFSRRRKWDCPLLADHRAAIDHPAGVAGVEDVERAGNLARRSIRNRNKFRRFRHSDGRQQRRTDATRQDNSARCTTGARASRPPGRKRGRRPRSGTRCVFVIRHSSFHEFHAAVSSAIDMGSPFVVVVAKTRQVTFTTSGAAVQCAHEHRRDRSQYCSLLRTA